jgi:antitoxin component of RelBE/YafQ-DinJ toxin-antitoxin module
MIHLTIDPQTDVALKLIEFLKTQPFVTVVKEPNEETIQAIEEARQGKLNEYNNSDELFEKLMKDAEI